MSTRWSKKDVEEKITNANTVLPKHYQLELGNRNGYYALDIRDKTTKSTARNTYDCGLTLKQCVLIVDAMTCGIYQLTKDK